jgi:DNA-binding NtrC family response regulator
MLNDSPRILVVDDDQENGEFLQEQLAEKGIQVNWFKDPRAALQQARRNRYQVGILDLKMPGMDGIELFNKLRDKDPEIGLIILTGYPSVDSVLVTLKTGAYDYMKKPYDLTALKRVVYRLLEEKGFFFNVSEKVNQAIGVRIKQYRLQREYTIAEMAARTKLSKSLISQIENAKNSASLVTLAKIAQSLNISVKDLVQDL